MELRLTPGERRVAVAGSLLTGLTQLALPELILDLVRFGFDALLDVSFVPRDRTAGRVRLLGVACCLLAALLAFVSTEE